MDLKVGNFSCDVEACLKMGKTKFIAAHPHVDDVEMVWQEIEKFVPLKESKPKKGNDETKGEAEAN